MNIAALQSAGLLGQTAAAVKSETSLGGFGQLLGALSSCAGESSGIQASIFPQDIAAMLAEVLSSQSNEIQAPGKFGEDNPIAALLGMNEEDWEAIIKQAVEKLGELIPPQKAEELKHSLLEGSLAEVMAQLAIVLSELPPEGWQKLSPKEAETALASAKAAVVLNGELANSVTELKKLEKAESALRQLEGKVAESMQASKSAVQTKVLEAAFANSRNLDTTAVRWNRAAASTGHQAIEAMGLKQAEEGKRAETAELKPSGTVMVTQQLSRTEQFVLHVNKGSRPQPDMEQFVKEFSSILSKSQLTKAPGMNRLLIRLYPEHLGSLRIELLQKDGLITARMLASTSAAKEMLDSQIQHLKTAFILQNIQVEKLDITFSHPDAQKFERQDAQGGQSQKDQNRNQDGSGQPEGEAGFSEALEASLLEMEA